MQFKPFWIWGQFVCSAENKGPGPLLPPANFRVICVGSHDENGIMSLFSRSGDELDILAPGEKIVSTRPRDMCFIDLGTSFAAPQVSALAALFRAFAKHSEPVLSKILGKKGLLRHYLDRGGVETFFDTEAMRKLIHQTAVGGRFNPVPLFLQLHRVGGVDPGKKFRIWRFLIRQFGLLE
jgi:subtilisin family serine protease